VGGQGVYRSVSITDRYCVGNCRSFYFRETISGHSGFSVAPYRGSVALAGAEQPIAVAIPMRPQGRKQQRERKMQAKALKMLVSRMLVWPPARSHQRLNKDSMRLFLAIQLFFLEKFGNFALRLGHGAASPKNAAPSPERDKPAPQALDIPHPPLKTLSALPAPQAAVRLANIPRPSTPPTSGSIRFSGCGISPSTLKLSL
jgi:hypothetical protein